MEANAKSDLTAVPFSPSMYGDSKSRCLGKFGKKLIWTHECFFYSQMAPPLMWQERPQFASWSKFDVHACHFCIVFDSLWMIIGKNPPRQMCVLSMKSYPLSRSPHINSAHDLSEEEIDIRLRKSSRRLFARNWHGTVVFTESSSSRKKNWW